MAKFKLEDYIYDCDSLRVFRQRIRHIHGLICPNHPEVWPNDFRYNEDKDMISYWVEHWADKFTCDYCERFDIPSKFISKKLSDKEIQKQWLKLHPKETEEVAINGIPKVNWDGSGKNTRTVIRYHVMPSTIADVVGGYDKKTHDGLEFTFNGNVVDAVNAWLYDNRHRILQGEMPVMESYIEEPT